MTSKDAHLRLVFVVRMATIALAKHLWGGRFSEEEAIEAIIDILKPSGCKKKTSFETIGEMMCKFIRSMDTPKERRPFMAFLRDAGVKRLEVKDLCGLPKNVHHKEWVLAGDHARYPGPGKPIPVEQKDRRQRLKLNDVDEMLAFVKDNGIFEQTAFGLKNVGT